jgi:hypothetical protein
MGWAFTDQKTSFSSDSEVTYLPEDAKDILLTAYRSPEGIMLFGW